MIIDQGSGDGPPTSGVRTGDSPTGATAELVRLFLLDLGALAKALAQHRDDGTGRCRVCSGGGQTGRYSYPCYTRLAADEALQRGAR